MKTGPAIAAQTLLAIAFVGALYMALCYVHDGVYFWFVGPEFAGLASFSDSLRYSVIWLPFLAAATALTLAIWARGPAPADARTEPRWHDRALALVIHLSGALIPIACFLAFGLGENTLFAAAAGVLVWVALHGFLFTPARARALSKTGTVRMEMIGAGVYAAIMLPTAAALIGVADGAGDMIHGRGVSIELAGDMPAPRYGRMVRALHDGVLVREGEDIRFLPWSSVSSIRRYDESFRPRPPRSRAI